MFCFQMGFLRQQPNGSYTKRHMRRLIMKTTDLRVGKITKSIERYFQVKNSTTSTDSQCDIVKQSHQGEVQRCDVNAVKPVQLIENETTANTIVLDNGNKLIFEQIGCIYEFQDPSSINDDMILKDDEFEYRYSDCEDSDSDEIDDNCTMNLSLRSTASNIISVSSDTQTSEVDIVSSQLKSVLSEWVLDNYITRTAFTDLLHRLRSDIPLLKLPLDSRTLIRTPHYTEIDEVSGGEYCYFGLACCLEKIIMDRKLKKIYVNNVELLINMDGAPVGKSTSKTLWPILCSDKLVKKVYIVGILMDVRNLKTQTSS